MSDIRYDQGFWDAVRAISGDVYTHRNGENVNPEIEDWYWVDWGDGLLWPLQWFGNSWHHTFGPIMRVMPNGEPTSQPEHVYGPIPRPRSK